MADEQHLGILKQGVKVWNEWRSEHPEVRPALSTANFCGANLGGACLRRADLTQARLSGANVGRADLFMANWCLPQNRARSTARRS
jgi:hypothetical protein